MKEEARIWRNQSIEHLGAAELLLNNQFYGQSIFFSEQAIETLLKAIWIENAPGGTPPYTHDLVFLVKDCGLELPEDQKEFLRKLEDQYTSTRYPNPEVEYTRETAESYYNTTREISSWLQQKLS